MPEILRCSRCDAKLKNVPIETVCNICEEKKKWFEEPVDPVDLAEAAKILADALSKLTGAGRGAGDIDSNGDALLPT